MKLIDLLIKELPSRGGFIKGANEAVQDTDGNVKFFDSVNLHFDRNYDCGRWCGSARASFYCIDGNNFITTVADDYDSAIVTREQYEAALKQVWNGEELPPVGTECEWYKHAPNVAPVWQKGRIQYMSDCTTVIKDNLPGEIVGHPCNFKFRPIRSEAERKREEAIDEIASLIGRGTFSEDAAGIYDDIAAHKIPGVTLVPTASQIVRVTEKCSREDAERIVTMLTGGTITE